MIFVSFTEDMTDMAHNIDEWKKMIQTAYPNIWDKALSLLPSLFSHRIKIKV